VRELRKEQPPEPAPSNPVPHMLNVIEFAEVSTIILSFSTKIEVKFSGAY
jgi:hypothetical protein